MKREIELEYEKDGEIHIGKIIMESTTYTYCSNGTPIVDLAPYKPEQWEHAMFSHRKVKG